MSYENQFTPWFPGELVIDEWEKITALAGGFFESSVRHIAIMEIDINSDLYCAKIRVDAEKKLRGE